VIKGIAQEMHVAALPGRAGEHLADRQLQAGMVVGNDKLDAKQAALLQRQEKLAPARTALSAGEIDTDDLALPLTIDRHGDQYRLRYDDPGFAHLLVARVENQVRERLAQAPLGKGPQGLVQ
jgi:hypothetical protein